MNAVNVTEFIANNGLAITLVAILVPYFLRQQSAMLKQQSTMLGQLQDQHADEIKRYRVDNQALLAIVKDNTAAFTELKGAVESLARSIEDVRHPRP